MMSVPNRTPRPNGLYNPPRINTNNLALGHAQDTKNAFKIRRSLNTLTSMARPLGLGAQAQTLATRLSSQYGQNDQ
jgi:hypothetical protein